MKKYNQSINYCLPSNTTPLSREEEKEEIKRIKSGDRISKERFVERNLNLLISIAKRYTTEKVELDDLIQEGYFGLEKALEKFDLNKGVRFSTYAIIYIKKEMQKAASAMNRDLQIGISREENIVKLNKAKESLQNKLARKPTTEEVAQKMNVTPARVKQIEGSNEISYSLKMEQTLPNNEGFLGEFIADSKECVEDKIMKKEMLQEVYNLIDKGLIPEILVLRYGMGYKQTEIADIYGITPQAVRCREKRTLERVKKIKEVQNLADYLDTLDSIATTDYTNKGPRLTKTR